MENNRTNIHQSKKRQTPTKTQQTQTSKRRKIPKQNRLPMAHATQRIPKLQNHLLLLQPRHTKWSMGRNERFTSEKNTFKR